MDVRDLVRRLWRKGVAGSPSSSAPEEFPWADTQRPWTDEMWLRKAKDVAALATPLARCTESTAAVPWHLWRQGPPGPDGRPTLSEVLDHPILDLWRKPNPMMTGQTFRELWQHYFDVLGRVPIRVEYEMNTRTPLHLWPISPTKMRAFPDSTKLHKFADGFAPFWEIVWKKRPLRLRVNEMIWITRPDPEDPYGWGVGLAQACRDDVEQIGWMNKWSNNFFRLGAHVAKIVGIPGLNDLNRRALQSDFDAKFSGPDNIGKTLFVATEKGSGNVTITEAGKAHRDMEWQAGQKFLGDRIRQRFGVPPEITGDVSSSNRATIDAADFTHQSYNTKPRVNRMAEEINQYLQIWWNDPTLMLMPENPVKESDALRHAAANDGIRAGVLTRNKWLEAHGMDPMPATLGDQLLMPANYVAVNPDGSFVPMATANAPAPPATTSPTGGAHE